MWGRYRLAILKYTDPLFRTNIQYPNILAEKPLLCSLCSCLESLHHFYLSSLRRLRFVIIAMYSALLTSLIQHLK